ncbi:MAG: hypothetical protein A3J79_02880 [Elusimicrobia bacterium RIFOXYB2_FULL_62_6]|nr:MAG: hypothetical protein A3J79_02880 [Elusimicrobia bacterium RIFOXYB2_FULL_62_6]
MIATELSRAARQFPSGALFKALKFLKRKNLSALPDGKVEIDGDRAFALVQRYATAPAARTKFEYHRKYIDVQYIAAGEEVIGWAPACRLKVSAPYKADKDACFGSVRKGAWTPVLLRAGELAVFWPEDAHAPKLSAGQPSRVMKIVVKLAADHG